MNYKTKSINDKLANNGYRVGKLDKAMPDKGKGKELRVMGDKVRC